MAIGVVISFLQVLTVGWAGLGFAVFMAAIDLYFFVCIYSLYDLFRNERLGPNNQVPMQNQTVIYTQPQQQPYAYQPQPVLYAQPPVYQPQQTFQQPPIIVQSSAPIPTNGDQNQQKIMVY